MHATSMHVCSPISALLYLGLLKEAAGVLGILKGHVDLYHGTVELCHWGLAIYNLMWFVTLVVERYLLLLVLGDLERYRCLQLMGC